MKSLKIFLLAAAAIVMSAAPASAQIFRWGVKVGTEVSSMKFDKSVFDGENRAGFTGGVMAELNVPIINIGLDVSLMYVHRVGATIGNGDAAENSVLDNKNFRNRDYLEIPVNLKYKFGLPVVGKFVSPYVFTGPSFAVLASKRAITEGIENRKVDISWNLGLGLQILNRVQIGASYGWGMNRAMKIVGTPAGINPSDLNGKSNQWTITAAWLF